MKYISLFSLLWLATSIAYGFRLDPMVADFETSGPNQSKVFRIENNGQERIAIALKATSRSHDIKGEEKRDKVDDFSIYPEQISLGPNDSRNIRVTYKGLADLKSEKAYRLIATQLPVDFKGDKKNAQLNFLFEYVASVYVHSGSVQPRLEIKQTEVTGANKVRVIIENSGTAHRLLKGVSLHLTNESGKNIPVKETSFQNWSGENILAGSQREFDLQTMEPVKTKTNLKTSLQISEKP
jgi:fimbrial chaperone protein